MRLTALLVACVLILVGGISSWNRGDARVVDGDTLAFGETRVRLWGIDAPESGTAAGRLATGALRRFIRGYAVKCVARDHDRYGRIVGQCFARGVDLAGWLVDNGLARDWPKYSNGYYERGI